jgi:hypothetical protein
MTIPSGDVGSITAKWGDLRTKQAHWAREIATFSRLGESKNSIPLGKSSREEVTIETKTIGASWP